MTDEEKKKEAQKEEQKKEETKESSKESTDEKPEDKKEEESKESKSEEKKEEPKESKTEEKKEESKETETPKSPSEKTFDEGYAGIIKYAKSTDEPAVVLEYLKDMMAAFDNLRQNNINLIDIIGKKYQQESDEKLDHKYEKEKVINIKDIPFKIQRSE